ncbi:MAG: Bax inhibitor-1/YccA family protein [Synergistaceae bacterium]|jgi:FtsH-binding integral membrane protein|nr:Bax inhibitor-1/YccA family protein [Synergistaceae bacterium]
MDSPKTYRTLSSGSDVLAQGFMTRVYMWMMLGLAATGAMAYYTTTSAQLLSVLLSRGTFLVLFVAEIGIVFFLSARIAKLNPATASALFFVYAVLNGLTIAPILLVYTSESVSSAFFTTAAMFGAMSAYGTLTKRDLSGWGSFLGMGLIGLIAASLINIFVGNSKADLVISIIGVFVFTGLTAFDTFKLRALAREIGGDEEAGGRLAIMGALTLYLDFINMFIFLLRIFGKRR